MAITPVTIPKEPNLEHSADYYFLRRKGIEFIEQAGSRWWTDYNSHDPGITMLEALCYAITDLGYRASWDIKDILADAPGQAESQKKQPFFTAREILSVNPLTINDFRRILIDQEKVSNAWLNAKQCACEVSLFADCDNDRLAYASPEKQKTEIKVSPLGTYDVFLELEEDPKLGDLNDRKIRHTFIFDAAGKKHHDTVTVEFRFPEWNTAAWGPATDFVDPDGVLRRKIERVTLHNPLQAKKPLADLEIVFTDMPLPMVLKDIPIMLFGSAEVTQGFLKSWDFSNFKSEELGSGVASLFLNKMATVERTLSDVKLRLGAHRNLCEDFCCVRLACVEEVGVCADIEVTPDADIEWVLANVLLKIEQYFNPEIKFYTLQELMAENLAVEDIFEGPMLDHGFVKTAELEASQLKSQLRTSDIINELVNIEGIVAVKNLQLTRYDQNGMAVCGVSDLEAGTNKKKISADWMLEISDRCQPRLSIDNSTFRFYKSGLPFTPKSDEVQDTLSQLRGQEERLKIMNLGVLDLPVPLGRYRSPEEFSPVQYSFPLSYGTGSYGVRESATEMRRAQARQMKAFLMVFEQFLANALAQLANVKKLFTLDDQQLHTYFVRDLRNDEIIRDVTALLTAELDAERLQQMAETDAVKLDRRNRFLDHVMARFGEQFNDYALQLTNYLGQQTAARELITDKIAFLKAYPLISRDRARGLNYKNNPLAPQNQAVLQKRIALLLGLKPDMEEKIIIVEHLLLRPRFPGDALMDVCLGKSCVACGQEDPYSFQLTVVMPGWLAPFDENIELRRFADRTILQEIPSHLLGKICWVSNQKYGEGIQKNLTLPLEKLLHEKGRNAGNARPSETSAAFGAEKIYAAAYAIFEVWISTDKNRGVRGDDCKAALNTFFHENLHSFDNIYSGVKNFDTIGNDIIDLLAAHFSHVVNEERWFVYDRFRHAWEEWLAVNAQSDVRPGRCSKEVVKKIEMAMLNIGSALEKPYDVALLVAQFGTFFAEEMRSNCQNFQPDFDLAKTVAQIFSRIGQEKKIKGFSGMTKGEKKVLQEKFIELYKPSIESTRKLWRVVLLLTKLGSIYPPATLHDCEDGNDQNPVRLGSTMLGE
jgi:hypothetical protein